MGRFLFSAGIAAAVLLAGASAQAAGVSDQHRSTSVIGGYAGVVQTELDNPEVGLNESAEGYLVGLDAYFNTWLSSNFATQFDLNARFTGGQEFEPGVVSYGESFSGGVHVAYRDPEKFALGVFGAAQKAGYHTEFGDGFAPGIGLVGVEGQAYVDDLTIYLQAGVAQGDRVDIGGGAFYRDYGQFKFVRGVLRYFLNDNLKLSAEASYAEGEIGYYAFQGDYVGTEVPVSIATIKLGVDWRPDGSDASFFAAYEASLNSQSISGVDRSSIDHRLLAGLKIDFAAETLKARDREGVTWDLPQLADGIAQGNNLNYCFIGDCFPNNVPLPP